MLRAMENNSFQKAVRRLFQNSYNLTMNDSSNLTYLFKNSKRRQLFSNDIVLIIQKCLYYDSYSRISISMALKEIVEINGIEIDQTRRNKGISSKYVINPMSYPDNLLNVQNKIYSSLNSLMASQSQSTKMDNMKLHQYSIQSLNSNLFNEKKEFQGSNENSLYRSKIHDDSQKNNKSSLFQVMSFSNTMPSISILNNKKEKKENDLLGISV